MPPANSVVEASIQDLADALSAGSLTSVDLVAKYLLRISTYDCRSLYLNSIPILNPGVFDEAAAADERRRNGKARGPLDGIPFTIKDSYKAKGMTVASGSEAFENLIANEDAFTVKALREAGAVLIGKTNMCPMAYGGMIRGVYGRAESPYNLDYLPAAFGSGSSNGSAVSVAASFAAFGMGEETVSSGRSPASNNALVAYTPSRGVISIRGNWPLYPTCDVVVPHTRSVDDLLILLDTIAAGDSNTSGDFWRDQPFTQLPKLSQRPKSFTTIKDTAHLAGKRIAVPRTFLEQCNDGPLVSTDTTALGHQAIADLEKAGAIVEVIDFLPVLQAYDTPSAVDMDGPRLPHDWNTLERGALIAHAWEDFLRANSDPNYPSLANVVPETIFPHMSPDNVQIKFTEPGNAIKWSKLAGYVDGKTPAGTGKNEMYDIDQLDTACLALEKMRKVYFEDWMDAHKYDYVAFPAAGDVGRSDADVDEESSRHAWTDGVKYSHGNRALRHLGIPSVTVPMGVLKASRMPMGLTILGRAYDDVRVLQAGHAFEQMTKRRTAPPLTPALPSDMINAESKLRRSISASSRPSISIDKTSVSVVSDGLVEVSIDGLVTHSSPTNDQTDEIFIDIYIDGKKLPNADVRNTTNGTEQSSVTKRVLSARHTTAMPPVQDSRNQVVGKVTRDSVMIMVLARYGKDGLPAGALKVLHCSQIKASQP